MRRVFITIRFMIFTIVFVLSLFYGKAAFSEVVIINEIEQLNTILKNVSLSSLVIFDVDEVLVYPENIVQLQIASSFWESTMVDFEKNLGEEKRDLLHSIMLLQSNWKLTNEMIPKLIHNLQLKKIKVLALTAFRSGKMGKIESVEDWRNMHLKKHDIDFSVTAGFPERYFEINKLNIINGKKIPVYKDGIMYTNHHPKGTVLKAFLEQVDFNPKEIIFIDDKIHNVRDVEEFCKVANIKFVGVHDNRIMAKHNIFDKNLGKYQFQYLEHYHVWLSDSEAKKKIANTQGKIFSSP